MSQDTIALAYLYGQLVDDRRFDELHRVLAPDVRITGPGYVMETLDNVLLGMEVLRQYDRTFHLVGNHLGSWETPDRFVGETYCLASHVYVRDGVEWKYDMAIRYQDCIVRRPEGLRFASRELRLAFTQDMPLSLVPPSA